MREFKFRVWDQKENCWFKSNKPWNLFGEYTILGGILGEVPPIFNDHLIVEQFTGLLDKNDKEIYEGDVLLLDIEGHHKIQPEVKFGSHLVISDDTFCGGNGWGFYIEYKDYRGNITTDSLDNKLGGYPANSFKIIGNIHENINTRNI